MATINAYVFEQRSVVVYPEHWKASQKKFIPLEAMEGTELHAMLDSITLAVEAGGADNFHWPQQFFANKAAFVDFLEAIEEYDECFRITDRWWMALSKLVETDDEEGFISGAEIAAELSKAVHENGSILNFGSKTPKYLHSRAACKEAVLLMSKHFGSGHRLLQDDERVRLQDLANYARFFGNLVTREEASAAYQEGEIVAQDLAKASEVVARAKRAAKKAAKKSKEVETV